MLVPTMTPEEIYAELYKDAAWLQNKVNCKYYPEFTKLAKRAKLFPLIKSYLFESPTTKITYEYCLVAYEHRDWDRPRDFLYTKYTHESGKTLIYFELDHFAIRIYTQHFLLRYRERDKERMDFLQDPNVPLEYAFLLKNYDVEEMDIFDQLDKNSPWSELAKKYKEKQEETKFVKDPDYQRYAVACSRGVCLCERHKDNPNLSIFDTFISPDMLRGEQILAFLFAYIKVFFREKYSRYPTQGLFIEKEWRNFMESIQKPNITNPVELMFDKLAELDERYPSNIII